MAKGFNLTAEINLRGPSNVRQVVDKIRKQLTGLSANVDLKFDNKIAAQVSSANKTFQTFNQTLRQTQSVAKATASSFGQLKQATQALNSSAQNVSASMKTISSASQSSTANIKKTADATQVMTTEFQEFGKQSALAVRRFAAFATVTGVIYRVSNAITSATQDFVDFEKELVKVAQVSNLSINGLQGLVNNITRLSTGFGVASKDLIEVSRTLTQAGLSASDTSRALEALAKSALAPTFDDLNRTVEGSVALMRQFGISAGQLESALGSINAVAGKFAVEAGDIITAISRTGGVFASASKGVSEGTAALNEFIAVFTSVRATTRESAETIATGLRTIFTRIQRGDTIDALKEYGVQLQDLEGKFVGPYEATRRLAEGLSRLDPRDIRFSRIVEELGGFRQIGKVIPLIQQFTTAQQALAVAQQGQGSLARDAATAQLSLANQITKVREEFTALIRSIGQSSGFKDFVTLALDLTSGLLRLADAAKGALPALTAIFAIKGIKALGQFGTGFLGGLKRGGGQTLNSGGYVHHFARGGVVPGRGSRDTVPAMLQPGEFVIRKKAVEKLGTQRLHNMNKFAVGGPAKVLKTKPGISKAFQRAVPETQEEPYQTGQLINADDYIGANVKYEKITQRKIENDIKSGKVASNTIKLLISESNKEKGNAFEEYLVNSKRTTLQRTNELSANYPVDFASKGGYYAEAKNIQQKLPNELFLDKLYRARVKDGSYGNATEKPSSKGGQNINLGNIKVFTIGPLKEIEDPNESIEETKKATATTKKAKNATQNANLGGYIQSFAKGGDVVPAMLTPGEFVINKKAASRIGSQRLNKLNKADRIQGFNKGGAVGSIQRFALGGGVDDVLSGGGLSAKDAAMLRQAAQKNIQAFEELARITKGWPVEDVAAAYKSLTRSINNGSKDIDKDIESIGQGLRAVKGSVGAERGPSRQERILARDIGLGDNQGASEKRTAKSIVKERVAAGGLSRSGNDMALLARESDKAAQQLKAQFQPAAAGQALTQFKATLIKTGSTTQAMQAAIQTGINAQTQMNAGVRTFGTNVRSASKLFPTLGPAIKGFSQSLQRAQAGLRSLNEGRLGKFVDKFSTALAFVGPALADQVGNAIGGSTGAGIAGAATGFTTAVAVGGQFGPFGALVGAAAGVALAIDGYTTAVARKESELAGIELDKTVESSIKTRESFIKTGSNADAGRLVENFQKIQRLEEKRTQANIQAEQPGMLATAAGYATFGLLGLGRDDRSAQEIAGTRTAEQQAGGENAQALIASMIEAGKTYRQTTEILRRQGSTISDLSTAMAEADPEFRQQVAEIQKSNKAEGLKTLQINKLRDQFAANKQKQIEAQYAEAERLKASKALTRVILATAASMNRTLDNLEQSISAASNSLKNASDQVNNIISGKTGFTANLDALNVLQNPNAFSRDEQNQALRQGSQFAGQDRAFVEQMGRFSLDVNDIIGSVSASSLQAGDTPEVTAGKVVDAVAAQLESQFGKTDLTKQIIDDLREQISKGGDVDIQKLLENRIPEYNIGKRSIEASVKALKFLQDSLNFAANASNEYGKLQSRIRDNQASYQNTIIQSDLQLKEALGQKITVEERIGGRTRTEAARAGVNPAQFNAQALSTRRDTLKKEVDNLKQALQTSANAFDSSVPGAARQFSSLTKKLAETENALKATEAGLESLPKVIEGNINDIRAEIGNIRQEIEGRQQSAASLGEKLVGSTPQELADLSNTYNLLNNTLNGQITTIQQSQAAQQAYYQTLQKGGTQQEAMAAAQQAFANQTKSALSLFNELSQMSGLQGPEIMKMRADLLENFAKGQGTGLDQNPMFRKILELMRTDTGASPEIKALTAALEQQQQQLGQAFTKLNEGILAKQKDVLTTANQAFIKELNNVRLKFDDAQLKQVGLGISRPGNTTGARPLEKGGVVYASQGKYVDFQPKGTDTVPAMLTPGEFVVNAKATKNNLGLLRSINSSAGSGKTFSRGGVVYAAGGWIVNDDGDLVNTRTGQKLGAVKPSSLDPDLARPDSMDSASDIGARQRRRSGARVAGSVGLPDNAASSRSTSRGGRRFFGRTRDAISLGRERLNTLGGRFNPNIGLPSGGRGLVRNAMNAVADTADTALAGTVRGVTSNARGIGTQLLTQAGLRYAGVDPDVAQGVGMGVDFARAVYTSPQGATNLARAGRGATTLGVNAGFDVLQTGFEFVSDRQAFDERKRRESEESIGVVGGALSGLSRPVDTIVRGGYTYASYRQARADAIESGRTSRQRQSTGVKISRNEWWKTGLGPLAATYVDEKIRIALERERINNSEPPLQNATELLAILNRQEAGLRPPGREDVQGAITRSGFSTASSENAFAQNAVDTAIQQGIKETRRRGERARERQAANSAFLREYNDRRAAALGLPPGSSEEQIRDAEVEASVQRSIRAGEEREKKEEQLKRLGLRPGARDSEIEAAEKRAAARAAILEQDKKDRDRRNILYPLYEKQHLKAADDIETAQEKYPPNMFENEFNDDVAKRKKLYDEATAAANEQFVPQRNPFVPLTQEDIARQREEFERKKRQKVEALNKELSTVNKSISSYMTEKVYSVPEDEVEKKRREYQRDERKVERQRFREEQKKQRESVRIKAEQIATVARFAQVNVPDKFSNPSQFFTWRKNMARQLQRSFSFGQRTPEAMKALGIDPAAVDAIYEPFSPDEAASVYSAMINSGKLSGSQRNLAAALRAKSANLDKDVEQNPAIKQIIASASDADKKFIYQQFQRTFGKQVGQVNRFNKLVANLGNLTGARAGIARANIIRNAARQGVIDPNASDEENIDRLNAMRGNKLAQFLYPNKQTGNKAIRISSKPKSTGGVVYASTGMLVPYEPRGTDTVPAMLTPGEFVINRAATQKHRPLLEAINRNKGGAVKYLQDGGTSTDITKFVAGQPIERENETAKNVRENLRVSKDTGKTTSQSYSFSQSFKRDSMGLQTQTYNDTNKNIEDTTDNLASWVTAEHEKTRTAMLGLKLLDPKDLANTFAGNAPGGFNNFAGNVQGPLTQGPFAGMDVNDLVSFLGFSRGGSVPLYAQKGMMVNYQPKGTDTVPAMLTPGEFVVNAKASKENLGLLQAINSGYMSDGGVVYAQNGRRVPNTNMGDRQQFGQNNNKAPESLADKNKKEKTEVQQWINLINARNDIVKRISAARNITRIGRMGYGGFAMLPLTDMQKENQETKFIQLQGELDRLRGGFLDSWAKFAARNQNISTLGSKHDLVIPQLIPFPDDLEFKFDDPYGNLPSAEGPRGINVDGQRFAPPGPPRVKPGGAFDASSGFGSYTTNLQRQLTRPTRSSSPNNIDEDSLRKTLERQYNYLPEEERDKAVERELSKARQIRDLDRPQYRSLGGIIYAQTGTRRPVGPQTGAMTETIDLNEYNRFGNQYIGRYQKPVVKDTLKELKANIAAKPEDFVPNTYNKSWMQTYSKLNETEQRKFLQLMQERQKNWNSWTNEKQLGETVKIGEKQITVQKLKERQLKDIQSTIPQVEQVLGIKPENSNIKNQKQNPFTPFSKGGIVYAQNGGIIPDRDRFFDQLYANKSRRSGFIERSDTRTGRQTLIDPIAGQVMEDSLNPYNKDLGDADPMKAFGIGAAKGVAPTAAGVTAGAYTTAATAPILGPAAPIAGLIAGVGAAGLTAASQEGYLDFLAPQANAEARRITSENPLATNLGGALPGVGVGLAQQGLRSFAGTLAQRTGSGVASAGIGAGIEYATTGNVDLTNLGVNFGTGFAQPGVGARPRTAATSKALEESFTVYHGGGSRLTTETIDVTRGGGLHGEALYTSPIAPGQRGDMATTYAQAAQRRQGYEGGIFPIDIRGKLSDFPEARKPLSENPNASKAMESIFDRYNLDKTTQQLVVDPNAVVGSALLGDTAPSTYRTVGIDFQKDTFDRLRKIVTAKLTDMNGGDPRLAEKTFRQAIVEAGIPGIRDTSDDGGQMAAIFDQARIKSVGSPMQPPPSKVPPPPFLKKTTSTPDYDTQLRTMQEQGGKIPNLVGDAEKPLFSRNLGATVTSAEIAEKLASDRRELFQVAELLTEKLGRPVTPVEANQMLTTRAVELLKKSKTSQASFNDIFNQVETEGFGSTIKKGLFESSSDYKTRQGLETNREANRRYREAVKNDTGELKGEQDLRTVFDRVHNPADVIIGRSQNVIDVNPEQDVRLNLPVIELMKRGIYQNPSDVVGGVTDPQQKIYPTSPLDFYRRFYSTGGIVYAQEGKLMKDPMSPLMQEAQNISNWDDILNDIILDKMLAPGKMDMDKIKALRKERHINDLRKQQFNYSDDEREIDNFHEWLQEMIGGNRVNSRHFALERAVRGSLPNQIQRFYNNIRPKDDTKGIRAYSDAKDKIKNMRGPVLDRQKLRELEKAGLYKQPYKKYNKGGIVYAQEGKWIKDPLIEDAKNLQWVDDLLNESMDPIQQEMLLLQKEADMDRNAGGLMGLQRTAKLTKLYEKFMDLHEQNNANMNMQRQFNYSDNELYIDNWHEWLQGMIGGNNLTKKNDNLKRYEDGTFQNRIQKFYSDNIEPNDRTKGFQGMWNKLDEDFDIKNMQALNKGGVVYAKDGQYIDPLTGRPQMQMQSTNTPSPMNRFDGAKVLEELDTMASTVSTGLGVAGMVPGLGEPFDFAAAAIDAARGDYTSAGLSIASTLPFAGMSTGAANIGRKATSLLGDTVTDLIAAATKKRDEALATINSLVNKTEIPGKGRRAFQELERKNRRPNLRKPGEAALSEQEMNLKKAEMIAESVTPPKTLDEFLDKSEKGVTASFKEFGTRAQTKSFLEKLGTSPDRLFIDGQNFDITRQGGLASLYLSGRASAGQGPLRPGEFDKKMLPRFDKISTDNTENVLKIKQAQENLTSANKELQALKAISTEIEPKAIKEAIPPVPKGPPPLGPPPLPPMTADEAWKNTLRAQGKSRGGPVYASNGMLIPYRPKGTDTVPAMLTPGEFVVNREATKQNLGLLRAINRSGGGRVSYLANGTDPGMGFDFIKPFRELSSVLPNIVSGFRDLLSNLQTPNGVAGGVNNNIGDLSGLSEFTSAFRSFTGELSALASQFPSQINLQLAPASVNVNITGGEVFNTLQPALSEMITMQVNTQLNAWVVENFDGSVDNIA